MTASCSRTIPDRLPPRMHMLSSIARPFLAPAAATMGRVALAVSAAAMVLAGSGCQMARPVRPVIRGDVDPTGRAWPFAATQLRIYPLTRLDRDAQGRPVIVVYLESVDRWGDFSKALGQLELRVYAGDRSIVAEPETLELTWPGINLSDLEENAAWFDPASKMYRFTLGGLSRSPRTGAIAESLLERSADAPAPVRLRVMAALTTVGPDGRELLLQDSYVIER